MTTLADAIEKDLAPLGEHAKRTARFVVSGEGDDVLADIAGRDVLSLKVNQVGADVTTPRDVMRAFGDEDAAAFVRLGRVYAATYAKPGHIEELEPDARWVEHLVWEGGVASPGFEASGVSAFQLAWIERGMTSSAPLVSAMLVHRGASAPNEFERYGFSMNAFGAPDAVDFIGRNDAAVNAILAVGELSAIKRLDAANVPIAPFGRALAKLVTDSRAPIRGHAYAVLARDPRVARNALEAIAEHPDTTNKERTLALAALEKLFNQLSR